jgi:hypothetical protein
MRSTLTLIAVGAFLLCVGSLAEANLLANGNLDSTYQQEIVPGFFLPKPTDWENIGTRAISGPYEDELSSEPWAGPAPTPVTPNDMGVFFKPFTGGGANGPATGHLQQAVPANPGTLYTLTGWAGAEANFLGDAFFAIDFLDGGSNVISSVELDLIAAGLFTPNGEPFNYKQYQVAGVAPAGTAFARARASMLDAIANPQGGGQAYVVDDFDLVPEPASFGLLLIGAAALITRRR